MKGDSFPYFTKFLKRASAISAPEAICFFCSLIIVNNGSKMRTEE